MYDVLIGFGVLSAVAVIVAVFLGFKCYQKELTAARYMGHMCLACASVTLFYFLSILPGPYRWVSAMSSLYFSSIDLMLLFLLMYVFYFTGHSIKDRWVYWLTNLLHTWICADILILLFNVFREISIHYVYRATPFAQYRYQRFFFYNCHLTLSYVMVLLVTGLLLQRTFTVPREYKQQYAFVILGIMTIVLINALFLYIPGDSMVNLIDWSLLGYEIATLVLYWTSFQYSTHGMLNRLKSVIFENIDQGLVLFDYMDQMILVNEKARSLMKHINFSQMMPMDRFISELGLGIDEETKDTACSLQCEVDGQFLRCDYSAISNQKTEQLGHIFIITNASLETDLMTGFQNLENFRLFVEAGSDRFPVPSAVAVFDINNLGIINSRFGRSEGDRRVRELAETMRRIFPKGTYFVRGQDAELIAICHHETESSVKAYIRNLEKDVDYAVSQTTEEQPEIYAAVLSAKDALGYKKLMDSTSTHHELVNSLINALEQCDSDTRAHVERTQKLGELLGKRIGLTDLHRSQLSLLCMLHDVGKIAIPLEVLNKPGALNPEEWKIM